MRGVSPATSTLIGPASEPTVRLSTASSRTGTSTSCMRTRKSGSRRITNSGRSRSVDRFLVLSCYPGPAVELFTQDIGVAGVPGGVTQDVDHDVEKLHIGARPPRHV